MAAEMDPFSPVAAIILSYVYQALFDLPQAIKATQRALELDPGNVLALTNLARLQFGNDEIEEARNTLNKARMLAPCDPEIYSLGGFISLALRKTDAAVDAEMRRLVQDGLKQQQALPEIPPVAEAPAAKPPPGRRGRAGRRRRNKDG